MPVQDPHVMVIDTNILWSDKPLRSGVAWNALRSYAAKFTAVEFVVPDVVVQELARQESERALRSRSEGATALAKAREALNRAGIDLPETPTVRDVRSAVLPSRQDIAEQMRIELVAAGVLVAPIPVVNHDILVSWSLDAHPPFDSTDKGYRDALIWRTVRDVAATRPDGTRVLFVNADKDYTQKRDPSVAYSDGTAERTLHAKLAADLRRVTSNTVTIVGSMRAAIALATASDPLQNDSTTTGLNEAADNPENPDEGSDSKQPLAIDNYDEVHDVDDYRRADDILRAAMVPACDLLIGEDIGSSYEGISPKFEYEVAHVENATVTAVIPNLATMAVDVHERFEGESEIGEVSVEAEILYEGHVFKSDAFSDNAPWTVADRDWNNHCALVEGQLVADLTFQFVRNNDDITLDFDDAHLRA